MEQVVPVAGIGNDQKQQTGKERVDHRPPRFRVVMHNDDYTTMEFVVGVLETIFRKDPTEAHWIMLNIHHKGKGICGIFPFDVAESKVNRVHVQAREEGFPLRCTIEEE